MNVFVKLVRYELKTLLRDPMNLFMMIYPFFILLLMGWVIPAILNRSGLSTDSGEYAFSLILIFVVILAIGGMISGILLGFSLLENKDDKTIQAIAVSPITVKGYTWFKSSYTFVIGFLGTLVMVGGLALFFSDAYSFTYNETEFGLNQIALIDLILFSFVSSLLTPTVGALIAAIAKNKIEGFALMKTAGILFIIPALILLDGFGDWKQYLLGIAPNFWPVKAFLNLAMNTQGPDDLSFYGYMVIGSVYMIILGVVSIRFFVKRASTERGI
jgi:fluoroquinolone transport system permease protein